MKNFILHAGMPKTATSALQRNIFPQAENLNYLGKYGWAYSEPELTANLSRFFKGETFNSKGSQEIKKCLDEVPEDTSILFSDETILKSVLPVHPKGLTRSLDDLAATIKEFQKKLPSDVEFHLMVVIRWQPTWLASRFAEDSKNSFFSGQKRFENYARKYSIDASQKESALDYNQMHECFSSWLGADRCHIFLYEDLAEEPNYFIGKLNKKFKIGALENSAKDKVNSATNEGNIWRPKRKIPSFLTVGAPLGKLVRQSSLYPTLKKMGRRRSSITLSNRLKKEIEDSFYRSNKALDAKLGGDMKNRGYY